MTARTLVDPNATPHELWPYRQFVCWKYGEPLPNKKPPKIPVNAKTLGNAGVTWLNTWCDIRTAVATYQAHDDLAGIGFVLTEHDPYTMIDLDNSVVANILSPFAAEVVDRIPTYWEFSPSERGLRGFVHCEEQPEALKRDEIEIYSKERWATLTGNVLHQKPIAHVTSLRWLIDRFATKDEGKGKDRPTAFFAQGATASQDDRELWERIFKYNQLALDLFNGNLAQVRGNGDPSRAVILLLNSLALWTKGDAGRMRRMMDQTSLDKAKWADNRKGQTWLDGRIQDAINFMGGR